MESVRTPYYAGCEYARMDHSDGGLLHAVGASNYQILRANRSHPEEADGLGYTYNHAPMLTFWRGRFYVSYLTNPVDENAGPGATLLSCSDDGIRWEKPAVLFPPFQVGPCRHLCADGEEILIPEVRDTRMHQRMGFFHSRDDRLLACGFYGHTDTPYRCPWVNYGIGRAVREIRGDGSLGEIYFVRILEDAGWREEELPYPLYTRCPDEGFRNACRELLDDRLVTQQWAEEHGNRDALVHLKTYMGPKGDGANQNPYEAFCWYHISDRVIVGMWKHSLVGVSEDCGETWTIRREYSFATSGGKMWGQRLPDGGFAAAYCNSLGSEHRYPLTVVTSGDGIAFDSLCTAFGETPPRRYAGLFKDFGPQYLRGICEGHREIPKDALWLCHSVNKEDIWVTRIPLPIRREETSPVDEDFAGDSPYFGAWNLYSPLWCGISKVRLPDGSVCMRLCDEDPADYARAMRCFPPSAQAVVTLELMAESRYEEPLEVELASPDGTPVCLVAVSGSRILAQTTSVRIPVGVPERRTRWNTLSIAVDLSVNGYRIYWNGECLTPQPLTVIQRVNQVQRVLLRTKAARQAPGMQQRPDTPDLPHSDTRLPRRVYYLRHCKIE